MSKEIILKKVFGNYDKIGDELVFYCPKCKHHKKKLSINLSKDAWKCWVCEYSGHKLGKLVKHWGGLYNSLQWEAEVGDKAPTVQEISLRTQKLLEAFEDDKRTISQEIDLPKEFWSLSNPKKIEHHIALNYLYNRGLTKTDILKWKIGYCSTGDYNNRVVIPSFNVNGKCDFFVARALGSGFKYQNPHCEKDKIIFNELFVDWEEDVVIVEGVFDAIKAVNAIPILGSTLKKDSRLFEQLVKYKPDVYIALDDDAFLKEDKIIELLISYGVDVYKINTSDIEDIGSITKEEFLKRKETAHYVDKIFIMKSKLNRTMA